MESQKSLTWFGIARRVDALLLSPGARERFRQQVEEAAAEWQRRDDAREERKKARTKSLKRLAHRYKRFPDGYGPLLPKPRRASFFWQEIFRDLRKSTEIVKEAWLPAELSPDLDPDNSLPLPVPDRKVSPAERYAVLAAVWDVHWRGEEKLDPCPRPHTQMWHEEFKGRLAEIAYYANLLVKVRVRADGTCRLSKEDRAIVQTWIAGVEGGVYQAAAVRGVSLLDAALILTEEDSQLSRGKRDAWQRLRTPKLPECIGNCPNHAQVKLYAPSALSEFVEAAEGKPLCTERKLRQRLNAKARTPRH